MSTLERHCASLTTIRVQGTALYLELRSGTHDITVRVGLEHTDLHALRHGHAAHQVLLTRGDEAPLLQLARRVAAAAGGAVTGLVVDLVGDAPAFRLRVGSLYAWDELPLPVTDAALLLVANRLPVEVVTPSVPDDWDAALAELVAERP